MQKINWYLHSKSKVLWFLFSLIIMHQQLLELLMFFIVLYVRIWKSHRIVTLSVSTPFCGLCLYQFLACGPLWCWQWRLWWLRLWRLRRWLLQWRLRQWRRQQQQLPLPLPLQLLLKIYWKILSKSSHNQQP